MHLRLRLAHQLLPRSALLVARRGRIARDERAGGLQLPVGEVLSAGGGRQHDHALLLQLVGLADPLQARLLVPARHVAAHLGGIDTREERGRVAAPLGARRAATSRRQKRVVVGVERRTAQAARRLRVQQVGRLAQRQAHHLLQQGFLRLALRLACEHHRDGRIEIAILHRVLRAAGQRQQLQALVDRFTTLADLRSDLIDAVMAVAKILVALRFLDRVDALPLQVLDQLRFGHLCVPGLHDVRGNVLQPGSLRSPQPAVACDHLETFADAAHDDRLDDARSLHAGGQRLHVAEVASGVGGRRVDLADRQHANAGRAFDLRLRLARRLTQLIRRRQSERRLNGGGLLRLLHGSFPSMRGAASELRDQRWAARMLHTRVASGVLLAFAFLCKR